MLLPQRPQIFLDGYNLALEKGTGVATYARNLSFALRDLEAHVGVLYGTRSAPSRNPLMREIGFFDPLTSRQGGRKQEMRAWRRGMLAPLGMQAARVPVSGRVVLDSFRQRLPYFDEIWNARDLFDSSRTGFNNFGIRTKVTLPQAAPAVMHWTYPVPARLAGARNIYTMHDLVPLRLPYTTLDVKRRYFQLCRMLARKADHIVTVSESARRDIIELLGVPEERVTNTYQAVEIPDHLMHKSPDAVRSDIEGTFGLTPGNYFLFFGAIEPKKNVGRLIEAYLASDVSAPLVIVGKRAWKSEQELQLLFDDHIRYLVTEGTNTVTRRRIVQLDYAPFPLLVSLIRGARSVLFPSLYEGFGLPVLEAMLLGTPVMTSNTSSLPEVSGDAALLVDPYSIREMVSAIRALDSDAELRARLAAAGPSQAARFSPERYRDRLANMYMGLGVQFWGVPALV